MYLENNTKNKIHYELKQIQKEFDIITLLSEKLNVSNLDPIELRAAATSMQSIYNGYEKVLIYIVKELKLSIPQTHSWHSDLLLLCKEKKIITDQLESGLRDLMGFRHFIRHAYSFMLDNELLEPLFKNMNNLFELFKQEILIGENHE